MSNPLRDDSLRARIARGTETLTAKDGTRHVIRSIRPDDAGSLMRGYDTLSDRGKWFRMLHAVPHLTPAMAAAYCSPDPETEISLVIEGQGALSGEIIGGARLSGVGPGQAAEFSVSMRPEAQGLGLARGALEAVLTMAGEAGCRSVWGLIALANRPMLGLAIRLGFAIRPDPDDLALRIAERRLTPD